jgi:hypothetical protein
MMRIMPRTAKSMNCAGSPRNCCPMISAASSTCMPSGGSYCAMTIPRGGLRHRVDLITMAASSRSPIRPAITFGTTCTTQLSPGRTVCVTVPGWNGSATVRVEYGGTSIEDALNPSPVASSSHRSLPVRSP